MPPYKAIVSRSQQRKLFALAARGELSLAEARGKTRAAKSEKLPEHVRGNRYHERLKGR